MQRSAEDSAALREMIDQLELKYVKAGILGRNPNEPREAIAPEEAD